MSAVYFIALPELPTVATVIAWKAADLDSGGAVAYTGDLGGQWIIRRYNFDIFSVNANPYLDPNQLWPNSWANTTFTVGAVAQRISHAPAADETKSSTGIVFRRRGCNVAVKIRWKASGPDGVTTGNLIIAAGTEESSALNFSSPVAYGDVSLTYGVEFPARP